MTEKQIIAAPAYLHETLLHELLNQHQTHVLGNVAVVPLNALLPKPEISESELLELSFLRIQTCKDQCPHFTSMIDNPSFLRQLCDFRKEMHEYHIELHQLPVHDEFQKELVILLQSMQDLPVSSAHQLIFLDTPHSFQHVTLYPSYHPSLFSKRVEEYMIQCGAASFNQQMDPSARIGFTALNRRQELEACAQYIIEHQLKPEEINLVLCDPSSDQKVLQLVFDRYGIPYGFTSKKSPSQLVQLFLAAVSLMKSRTVEQLVSFLHHAYSSLYHFDDFISYLDLFIESSDEILSPFQHVTETLKTSSLLDQREQQKLLELEQHAESVRQQIQLPSGNSILEAAYEFCRTHSLIQNAEELKVFHQLKAILEAHAQHLHDPALLELICFEIEALSKQTSESFIQQICVTDLTHPVPPRTTAFVMGCIQSSFPNFKECSGVFDEDYVSQVKGYPSKTERQKFNSEQTSWIFHCGKTIIFSSSSADYEGKGRQMSVEIESRLDHKPSSWKINQYQKKHRIDFTISESTAKQLFFQQHLKGSISSFERWFSCPASYFLTYGLKLRKQQLAEFNLAMMGTLQHAILEEAIRRYQKNIHLMSHEELHQLVDSMFQPFLALFKKKASYLHSTKIRCQKNMTLIFDFLAEMEKNTDFIPTEQEKRFNMTLLENTEYPVELQGIIDRIDMTHDMLRILDYKSSHKSLSAAKVKSGLQLQLLTYLYVASLLYQKTAAGSYYVSMKNDDIKAISSKVDGRKFEIIDPEENEDRLLWMQSHRLDGMTFADTNMLDFDGTHIKNFKNGRPSKIIPFEDVTELIHVIYSYLSAQLASGNISLTPTENACMFCDHFSICRFHSLKVKSIVPEELTSHLLKEVKKS